LNPRFIDIGEQRLAYFESTGAETSPDSPSVLFVHGSSFSSRSFIRQLESPLGKKYRLASLDLPGHGMSAPARDPKTTYTMSVLGGIIFEFTERVGLKDAVFVGLSLGGNLLVEALELFPAAKGLMLVGCLLPSLPIDMSRIAYHHPALASLFKADLTDEEINTWAAALVKPGAVPP